MYKYAFFIALAASAAAPVSAQLRVPVEDRSGVEVSPAAQALIDADAIHIPGAQWSLREAIDGCSVQREFYLDDDHITFALKRLQADLPIEYALIGGDFDPEEGLQAGFVPGTGLGDFRRAGSASTGNRDGVFFAGPVFHMAPGHYAHEGSFAPETQYFVAQDGDGNAAVLRTGAIDLALEALEECGNRQVARLGVDMAERAGFKRNAILMNSGDLTNAISLAYGKAMRNQRRTVDGALHIRLVIDEDGALANCHASDGLTPRILREALCDIIREDGEFRVALDGQDNPVTDYWTMRVVFEARPPEGWSGADGRTYPARD